MNKAVKWSLWNWMRLHDAGYFPNSEQHKDWKVYKDIPDWLKLRCRSKDVALEIGCGYGEWMIPLSREVYYVYGIDLHDTVIDKATELFDKYKINNASVMQNDGLTVPFEDEKFDLVYSISVFQHLPRAIVQGYLEESVRAVKPSGTIVHHFRNADNVGPYPPLSKDIKANHTGDFSVGWTKKEILAAGKKAGIKGKIVDLGLFLLLVGKK